MRRREPSLCVPLQATAAGQCRHQQDGPLSFTAAPTPCWTHPTQGGNSYHYTADGSQDIVAMQGEALQSYVIGGQ